MNYNFGEIVEPPTRALIDENLPITIDLEIPNSLVLPPKINTLLIADTSYLSKLLKLCLVSEPMFSTKKNELTFYKLNDHYIVVCKLIEGVSIGKATEILMPWINLSKVVYAMTTSPLATYQNKSDSNMLMLSTDGNTCYPTLQVPNLVTGVTAGVFSYAKHVGKSCSLFIGYIDNTPLDSVNSKPFVELLRKIDLPPVRECVLQDRLPEHNLYM